MSSVPPENASEFKIFGVYLPSPVVDAVDLYVYEEAGVVDLREYFERDGTVPEGDPGAEAVAEIVHTIVTRFDELFGAAQFSDAEEIRPENRELVHLAGTPEDVYLFREKVDAASVIKECDYQTVHTAIFTSLRKRAYLDE